MQNILLILILFYVCCIPTRSQNINDWIGLWKGELVVLHEAGTDKMSSVHMQLHISKTDSANILNWGIIYRDSTKDYRKYLLRIVDKSKGKYLIDERDGILLEANLFESTLVSRFEVTGTLLEVSYKLDDDKIVFEVTTSQLKPTSTTKSTVDQVEVNSYTVTNIQRAYLFRSQ